MVIILHSLYCVRLAESKTKECTSRKCKHDAVIGEKALLKCNGCPHKYIQSRSKARGYNRKKKKTGDRLPITIICKPRKSHKKMNMCLWSVISCLCCTNNKYHLI